MVQTDEAKKTDVHGAGLISKACDVLDLVGANPGRLGVRELVERTGLPKSSIYRIVAALESRGMVRSDRRGQALSLGFHFLDLAQNVWSSPDLVVVASTELRRLREMTGETAYLSALSGNSAIVLARSLGAHENSSMSALGISKPLYCTSQGKAILAHVAPKLADQLIAQLSFEPMTPYTISNAEVLKHRLEIVRQRGFSVDDQEILLGTRCVGAPVIDAKGNCIGAISVAGPAYRMTLERIEQLGPELIDAARSIGANLTPRTSYADATHISGCRAIGEFAFASMMPFWSAADNRLYWADRLAPAVHALDPNAEPGILARMPHPIDALGPAPGGGTYIVCEDGWYHAAPGANQLTLLRAHSQKIVAIRLAPDGKRWGAIVGQQRTEIGAFDSSLEFQSVWTINGELNDLVVAPDSERLFGADGHRGVIYEFQRGRAAPHIVSRIPRGSGEPRGLALDAEGKLWVALWDGWSIARLDDVGEIERIIALPVPRPTGLAFGGAELSTLYVTTARLGLSREILENAPLSGRLLALGPGVAGAQSQQRMRSSRKRDQARQEAGSHPVLRRLA